MNQQQWHDWRRQGIGASDAPAVMGCHIGGKSIAQLKEEKLTGISTQKVSAAMQRGNDLESEAINWFVTQTGYLLETQKRFEHPERPWMRCTIDGIDEENGILVETKVTDKIYEEVPVPYVPQCQHQMDVVTAAKKDKRYKKMYFVPWSPTLGTGKIIETVVDEEYTSVMVQKEQALWDEILTGFQDMEKVEFWTQIKEDVSVIDNALLAAKKLYKESIKDLEERRVQLLSDAILFANGTPARGQGLKLYKKSRQGSVDATRLLNEKGVDINLYRKDPTFTWSLELE